MGNIKETDLYQPIKSLFEEQHYEVKGEIGKADVIACRGEEDPVVVELKSGFSLTLVHQAIERKAVTDLVYVAVPRGTGKPFAKALKRNTALCRLLGVGLITVRMRDGFTEIHADPGVYHPRKSPKKKMMMLREFKRRVGDPNEGGSARNTLITAYRQDALRCAQYLDREGPTKAAIVANSVNSSRARNIMADDHYGWFSRVARGIYELTPMGVNALVQYSDELAKLMRNT